MRSAIEDPSHLVSPDHETQDGEQSQLDSTDTTRAIDQSKLTAVWANCAGLLILYFTCVPPSKQVH